MNTKIRIVRDEKLLDEVLKQHVASPTASSEKYMDWNLRIQMSVLLEGFDGHDWKTDKFYWSVYLPTDYRIKSFTSSFLNCSSRLWK
jgi:hypothetical protein